MSYRIRFEVQRGRHRPDAKKPRRATDRWRGRALGPGGRKLPVMNVRYEVLAGEIAPFLQCAGAALRALGASEVEVHLALGHAEKFLRAHQYKEPKPAAHVSGLARTIIESLRRRGRVETCRREALE